MTRVTGWAYDVQGRLTTKTFPDASTVTYAYETTTSRLKSVTDAMGQVKTYAYARDDRPTGVTYTNATNPTPNVGFAWDPYFPRLVSMTDGTGTRQYTYVPVGSLGALRVQQESGPLAASAITSAYDELGRLSGRTVQGAGADSFQYDPIGRLTGHGSDLGSFTLSYLGQTDQVTSRQRAASTLATTWSYLSNTGDRRLAGIANTGLTAGQFSTYAFTSTPEDFIASITETSDAATVYPAPGAQTTTYNNLNQLTNLSGQARTYDALGNLTSDGLRTYTWDAENRLVGIAYPGAPGKASAFTYDGLGRRVAIAETPAGGGSATIKSYLWCGQTICQARDSSNALIRSYYGEGELISGSPGQSYYYGIDQIGSVRRVFASISSAPAYSFDPYGLPLQVTAPVTDFGYAGMFNHTASGLNLTLYRAYDPVAGRWLSRDPLGEDTDPAGNLYAYVGGEPISLIDPTGEHPVVVGAVMGAAFGAAISIADQLRENGCVSLGRTARDAAIGAAGGGALAAILKRAAAHAAARAAAARGLGNQNPLYKDAVQRFNQASQLSKAGRGLTKHPALVGATKGNLRQVLRTEKAVNSAAHQALQNVMRNGVTTSTTAKYAGPVTQIVGPSGFGARWSLSGSFVGFIEP